MADHEDRIALELCVAMRRPKNSDCRSANAEFIKLMNDISTAIAQRRGVMCSRFRSNRGNQPPAGMPSQIRRNHGLSV